MSNGLPDLYERGRQAGIREALEGNLNTVDARTLMMSISAFCEKHSTQVHTCNFKINMLSHWEFTHSDQDYEMKNLRSDWGIDSLIKYLGLGGEGRKDG